METKYNGSRNPRTDLRRKLAAERAEARMVRTHKQQLALLDQRLGKDVGAAKERARLSALLEVK